MKSINHIVIQGWMCNELNLKGNELLIFAMIYGFSQDGETRFYGSRNYIADTFNISLPTVDKALQSLEAKNLIEVTTITDSKGVHNEYEVCKETLQGVVKKLYRGSKETLHNNIINNIDNNKTITINSNSTNFQFGTKQNKPKKSTLWDKCLDAIIEFTDDSILRDLLVASLRLFLENNKELDKPFYTNTFKGKLNNLSKLSEDNYEQRKIVQQTLDNGWNNFYQLKENKSIKKASTDIGYTSNRAKKVGVSSGEKF